MFTRNFQKHEMEQQENQNIIRINSNLQFADGIILFRETSSKFINMRTFFFTYN